ARPAPPADWPSRLSVSQPVFPSALHENKLHNIRLACGRIAKLEIAPGAIFSFWAAVGRPGRRQGFREGRNLINGRLQSAVGGGLCQISGLIYHLALLGGLEVLERYPHSLDIYTEETRYTPLGADATVVFGYKDLRLRNPLPQPLRLGFAIADDRVEGWWSGPEPLPVRELEFRRFPAGNKVRVETWQRLPAAAWQQVTESHYRLLPA
ncbi:MAG: hypothetical protein D6722_08795, partial [Bacteroidetes bacterium]